MSYLKFEKALMTNLQESIRKEILQTDRSGGYSSSTIVDCNTRKYHGLLVVPIPSLDDEHHVLLSSLDASVIQNGVEFALGVHLYEGGVVSPRGQKYIRSYECDRFPCTMYRVGGVILRKETLFETYEDRLLIRYTVDEAQGSVDLRLKPYLAFRRADELTHENYQARRDYREVENGISTTMYDNYPELFMQLSKKNEYHFDPSWYKGLEYYKEAERGYDSHEDLYVPGYFDVKLKKGESVIFTAALSKVKPSSLVKLFDTEVAERNPRDNFYHCMVSAAHQLHYRRGAERYVLAGYPWFKVRARDTFVSLPGLCLATDDDLYFEDCMKYACKGLREFMEGRPLSVDIHEIEQPDVMLWAVWCIQQYVKKFGHEKAYKQYGKLVIDMIKYIESGKHINLQMMPNGLLHTEGREKPMTWMNSIAYGKPVVPRTGYIVEINALWYNALVHCAKMAEAQKDKKNATYLWNRAEQVKKSFQETFVNEAGYLWDYVEDGIFDPSVRPNMILAVALEHSPLEPEQQKKVLDFCTRELLTPKGLRSLSPKSGGYNPNYVGQQVTRDYAYHNGSVWPWLGGFYMEACLKIYKRSRLSFVQRQMVGFEDEISYHALSTISELFDGNPPFHGRGAMSFAMNVAEILRTMRIIDQYNN